MMRTCFNEKMFEAMSESLNPEQKHMQIIVKDSSM